MSTQPAFDLISPLKNRPSPPKLALLVAKRNQDLLGANRVLTQVAQDLFGTKDVQDAIMASYVWMADQIGHIALGGILTLIWCWGIFAWVPEGTFRSVLYIAGTLLIFGLWIRKESADFREVKVRAKGSTFQFNTKEILWNVATALFFLLLGGVLAVTPFFGLYAFLATILVGIILAVFVSYWWLRRKIAFQQAGLPYLFRLANFKGIDDLTQVGVICQIAAVQDVFRLQEVFTSWIKRVREKIEKREERLLEGDLKTQHLVISGVLGTGKTSLAVGIGTEYAFSLGIGRYLSAIKLLELAAGRPRNNREMESDDGRILWPWRGCNLLIIDDVDAGVPPEVLPAGAEGAANRMPPGPDLTPPEAFKQKLIHYLDSPHPLEWLKGRRSVWVVGDPARVDAWKAAIADLMNIDRPEEIMSIKLQERGEAPEQVPKNESSFRSAGNESADRFHF